MINGHKTPTDLIELKAWLDQNEAEMERRHAKRMREIHRANVHGYVIMGIGAAIMLVWLVTLILVRPNG